MIIPRHEVRNINAIKKWLLIYGRRKTGKTFLIRHFLKYNEYFFVKRDRTIIVESTGNSISYETLKELLDRMLKENKYDDRPCKSKIYARFAH